MCLFGFLTSSSTTRLYTGLVPRLKSDNFTCCHTTRQSGETMTSVSAGHIILTPTQPVGSGRPHRRWNPRPPHTGSHALPPPPPPPPPFSPLFCHRYIQLDKSILSRTYPLPLLNKPLALPFSGY